MPSPVITVAIPTYNRSQLLAETISSVLAQTYGDFQVLICDNASPDDTRRVAESFHDPRIVFHRHAQNIGMQRNWRFALTHPTTRYVALTSDDDLFLPNHLDNALALLEPAPQATLYACASEVFGEHAKSELYGPEWVLNVTKPTPFSPCGGFLGWLAGCPVTSCSVVIRRAALDRIGNWGGKKWPVSMDWLWWGQLAILGDFIVNPVVGSRYRRHEANFTHGWQASGVSGIESRYTIRTLAQMAYQRGCFTLAQLIDEVLKWPSGSASSLVVALATRSVAPDLRQAAFEIWRRHPTIRSADASFHAKIAARVGSWYLRYADSLHRWRHRWPPKDAP